MLKEFANLVQAYMVGPSIGKKFEVDKLYNLIMKGVDFTEKDRESVKTVYSYVEWISAT